MATYANINLRDISNNIVLIVENRKRADTFVVHKLKCFRKRLVAAIVPVSCMFLCNLIRGLT
jgi:hypothetical protein